MSFQLPSEETLRKMIEWEWQDHFQTRAQTWKALEVVSVLAIAVVGLDWQVGNLYVTCAAAVLLLIVAQFGIEITKRHRKVEQRAFQLIIKYEGLLGIEEEGFKAPGPLGWLDIFRVSKSSTSLFIMRMHFFVQVFAISYVAGRLLAM